MRRACLLLLFATACSATGDPGGGASHLPVSGAGPFQPLSPEEPVNWSAPVILTDLVDLDQPYVIDRGTTIDLWVTAHRTAGARIEHATLTDWVQGFGDLQPVLVADQDWEGGAVTSASLIGGSPAVMFYAGAGGISWAVSSDATGASAWTKAPGPALVANGGEEGATIASPSAIKLGDRVRVFYLGNGSVWAADAPFDDVVAARATNWTRVDGDPTTAGRDPIVPRAPFATGVEAVNVRAGVTPTGRVRYDAYFTADDLNTSGMPVSTCGFASSFTADEFAVAPLPILPAMVIARGCAETPYQDVALLFYVERSGAHEVIAVARSPQ